MDIKISALDNVTSAAKDFLQKVITPPLEEVGLLLSDKVKVWRFKNQVKVLKKAEESLKEKNLKTKKVSLKVLTPLLEGSSFEDDENIQQKWAALLVNTVSLESNVHTTLYSYILGQLTLNEARLFKAIFGLLTVTDYESPKLDTYQEYNNLTLDEIKRGNTELSFTEEEIDNLIRLRLIKELNPEDVFLRELSLTQLGFNFYLACQF